MSRLIGIIFLLCCIGSNVSFAKNRFPILASRAIEDGQATIENYTLLEKAGFTLAFQTYSSLDEVRRQLKAASSTTVKLIIWCPELEKDLEKTVSELKRYKSFGGYYISDEPNIKSFRALSNKIRKYKSLDSKHHLWINIYPNSANKKYIGTDSYDRYLSSFFKIVNPPVVSFDHYGIMKKGLRPEYYKNLEDVSRYCKNYNKPFWAYVLASEFEDYATPTKGTLSFQAYSNLAYGAQGIEYFSYRRIIGWGLNMKSAIVDTNYHKMPVYEAVKELNTEIQFLSDIFKNNTIVDVIHFSSDKPLGTKSSGNMPKGIRLMHYSGKGFVVSYFKKNCRNYILLVNKDYDKSQDIVLESKNQIQRLSYYKEERDSGSGIRTYTARPGSIILLQL